MFVKTDSGMLNLDYIVLVQIRQQFMRPRDDGYELKAITTNIRESSRQSSTFREGGVGHSPAEISPYSVQITQGTLKDCEKVFDKISEQDNFIKFTVDEYSSLLNLKHVIGFDMKQSSNGQNDSLEVILNTFCSKDTSFQYGDSACHFPSLLPYKLTLYKYKEIIEASEKLDTL